MMKTQTDIAKWYIDKVQEQLAFLLNEDIWNNRFVKNVKDIDKQYHVLLENLTKE